MPAHSAENETLKAQYPKSKQRTVPQSTNEELFVKFECLVCCLVFCVCLCFVFYPLRHARLAILSRGVSPFGDLRIKGCSAPPRSVSSPRYVLHRLLKPRHPPYALVSHQETYNHFLSCSMKSSMKHSFLILPVYLIRLARIRGF